MNRKVQLLRISIFIVAIFVNMASSAKSNEGTLPVNAPAAPVNQDAVSGEAAKVVMDPNAIAVLPTDSFDFGSVYEGNDMFHDFIIRNKGTAELKIINVKSGCGCTTVSYDRAILPGEEGKIKVKVATKGYGGNKISKSVDVDTNDPKHSKIELKLSGDVKNFATIIPKSIYFNGKVGEKLSQVVKIIPETEMPFKIMKATALNGTDIRQSLSESDQSGKKMYVLTVENVKETPGRYFDMINIITDRSDQTPLTVYVRGNIIEPGDNSPKGGENADTQQAPPQAAHEVEEKGK